MKIFNVVMWFEKSIEQSIPAIEPFLISDRHMGRFVLAEDAITACAIAKEYYSAFPLKIYRDISVLAEVQDISRYQNRDQILRSYEKVAMGAAA